MKRKTEIHKPDIAKYDAEFVSAVNKMLPQMISVIEKDFDEDLPQERQKAVIEAKKLAVETYVTVRSKLIEITETDNKTTDALSSATSKKFSADDFV